MWVLRVFSAVYLTAVCWAPDPQDDNISASPLLTVRPTAYEPPIPSLQQQQPTWLDVFPSEKVVFICSITGSSDWTFTWSRDNKQIQGSDPNVLTSASGSVLTITAAQIHSGSYTCKGLHTTKGVATADSNPLTLKVSANKPKPTLSRSSNFDKMFPGESISFTCKVEESSGWEYLWYHNDTEIKASESTYKIVSINKTNSGYYYCKAKRGQAQFYTDNSETTILQVSDPPKPDLKLETQWMDVFDGETVELMCEIPDPFINSDWAITWNKDHQKLEMDDVLDLDPEEQLLNITSITQAYQGGYTCEFRHKSRGFNSGVSNTVNITVYDGIPKPKLRKDPDSDPMYFGETVNFTCSVDVSSGWEYKWYKDGNDLSETSEIISIQVGSLTTGNYMCGASRGDTTSTDNSEVIRQDALEIPVPSLKLITSWSDVFPDESVKLSCGLNRSSEWTYTWYKDGQQVQADNVVSFESRGATLSIQSASAVHAGQYKCMGNLKHRSVSSRFSSGLNLSVYDKKPTVTLMQDPDYNLMFPGESVSFRCHINISSGWEYLWHQDSKSLGISGNTYKINPTGTTNQGLYKCKAKRGTDQVFITDFSKSIRLKVEANKPKPSMTRRPDVDKLYTGESVSFECKVAHSSGWEYFWYKNGTQLPINSNIFNITNTALLSTGVYSCMATRNKTMYKTEHSNGGIIHIYEIPKPSVKLQTQWLDVFPTESVKLSCGMDRSSDWTYTWYKHGEKVLTDNNLSFDSDATTLSISSASAFHSGQYTCLGKLKSRSVQSHLSSGLTLRVYGTKPRLILTQDPSHSVMHTSDSVSFSCHVNVSTGWEYLWYKDGSLLAESGKNYTIASVLTKNTGSYKCQTKRGSNTVFLSDESQTVKLDIKERPKAEIVLLTGWSEVFSTDSLVLKCGVEESQDTWNYTWFKEDQPIDLVTSERHIVTPQNDPEQSLYTCQGIRSGRPSYSVISAHFKTKNLLLKRRVLLSISGCIVFGIVAVFFGCIFLKVFRKPAKDEYKPEEADLFLTMDQLKNRDDAPCPLVQYITNEELSASPKEGDENGTLCSETTPLPISPQEDQAVTAENQEATESNGGLVSFKQ